MLPNNIRLSKDKKYLTIFISMEYNYKQKMLKTNLHDDTCFAKKLLIEWFSTQLFNCYHFSKK
jgi:hypothetical protein